MTNYPEYVKPSEGAKILGVEPKLFFYYAKRRSVRTKSGNGERKTLYNYEDLLKVSKELDKRKKDMPIIIDWIRSSDVPAGLKLAQTLYGEDVDLADAARYQAWRRYNPHISMGAFSPDRNECYAALMLVPLSEQSILDICAGKRTESSIDATEVLLYDHSGGYTLLATSALCLPDRPHLLYRIIIRMMDFFVEMYPEKYVTRIYAQAVSEAGDKLVQMMYMAPRYDLAPDVFMLDMSRPSLSKIIRRFQVHLDAKAERPDELKRWPT